MTYSYLVDFNPAAWETLDEHLAEYGKPPDQTMQNQRNQQALMQIADGIG